MLATRFLAAQDPGTPPLSPTQTSPTPGAVPPPIPDPTQTVPSRPAYDPKISNPQNTPLPSTPAPEQTPPPVIAPVVPTPQQPYAAYAPYGPLDEDMPKDTYGSTYIPVDSWIYPAMTRLYSLGYADTMFLGMRPWTRRSVLHMLEDSEDAILRDRSTEAEEILATVRHELRDEVPGGATPRPNVFGLYSAYTRLMGVGGPTLRDSYHLGTTVSNDYGRPYASGFNNITGFETVNEVGRFSLHIRGEYQHAPSRTDYTNYVGQAVNAFDALPYIGRTSVLPVGTAPAQNPFRVVEAALSFHLLGHEISGGKTDAWLGPAQGGAMPWSNNAENIYSFRINRVEPMTIPYVSKVLGTLRYDFFYGDLKGHLFPRNPYVHSEMFSFRPTGNFEFGFQRTVIFGGEGHEPVTLHTFFRSFFSINDTTADEKSSARDPGARFSAFNFSYRLPFLRRYATLYADSITHDDVTPISAPRRAAYRTGLYLSHIPGAPRLDLRAEAVTTDPGVRRSIYGSFNYYEIIQKQGYTNSGYIMGDWIGREAKGGQAWLTYHLSGNEWVQLEYLNKKNAKDFVGGTTQNQIKLSVVKRIRPQVEFNGWLQYERWKAPIYKVGSNSDTVGAVQLTWYPKLHTSPELP